MAIRSVSEVNKFIKQLLASTPILGSIMVRGEISNFKCYASGHCYFTLKDANSALKCVMFRSHAQYLRFQPVNGLSAVASGNIAVYERDGVYQLYVDSLLPEGKGDLALAYEQLKNRLSAEGLFANERKKTLPRFPEKIGVVTSLSGAVLRDIYHVIKRRWPAVQLVLYPVQVQGDFSAEQVAAAIEFFNAKYTVDVMIVGRGGGSMEDLWSFNEEVVVRAIAASKIPIISAVGHETDFSLADFAADVRAATPSQAAELAVPDRDELKRYVVRMKSQLSQMARQELNERRLRLQVCQKNKLLQSPELLLADRRQRLDTLVSNLRQCIDENITTKHHQLSLTLEKLSVLNPAKTLQRGFTLVEHGKKIVTRAQEVKEGDKLQLTFSDGKVSVVVADLNRKGD